MNTRRFPIGAASPALLATLFGLAFLNAATAATGPQANDLITRSANPAERVALPARAANWATPANDRGVVPDDLPLAHLSITLKRSAARRQAFEQLLRDQQDPSSPDYHHWLSPREIGERFGASAHDIDAIANWLRGNGLSVDSISNSRTRVRFSGSAAAVSAAFATELRYYRAAGEKRIANAVPAEIPRAFAGAIRSVDGLRSVRYHPTRAPTAPRRATRSAGVPSPQGTNCSGGTCSYVVFPSDFNTIYGVNGAAQQGLDGSGQTIAIVGRARVYEPDMLNYEQRTGLAVRYPTVIVPPTGTDPGAAASTCSDTGTPSCSHPSDAVLDQGEATLDVQRVLGVAPAASIDLIVSTDANSVDGVYVATDYAIDTDPVPAKILSISFATCEADNGSDVVQSLDDFFGQAAAEGISVFVASGDSGVAGCASLDATPTPTERESPNALCSSGHVTCVGGTEFADRNDPSQYWRSSNGAYYESALGYIPEGAWNEPLSDSGDTQLAATGGGVSAYVAKPSWQTAVGVPGSAGRYTPDVSFNASTREGYFTCIAAQGGPCSISGGSFTFLISGGTSASAPSMAGVAALLNQKNGAAQGNLNPRIYALAGDPGNAVFHDATVATSGVSGCTLSQASPCNNSTPGPNGVGGGLSGYLVGAGYDEATGLGSLDVTHFIDHWNDAASSFDIDQAGLTGPWYNPSTSGQGVVMQILPDYFGTGTGLIFGGWFTFDVSAAGGERWYTVQGQVTRSSASTTMPIYVSQGGNFDAPPAVGTTEVGQATLAFSDCTHATMSYAFNDGSGRSGSIPLQRLGANAGCTPGAGSGVEHDYLLSGAWYDSALSGQGFVFDVNPVQRTIFAAWYTYAGNGQQLGGGAGQRWYTLQADFTPGATSLSGIPVYATSGGVFDDPATATTTQVGTANLVFHDCSSATLSYTFNAGTNGGRSDTIALSRATPAPSGCSL